MEFKGTPAPWVVDIRNGCCAVYQKNRTNDTAGCHRDDDRNIVYSSKGASEFNLPHQHQITTLSLT